MVRPLGEEPIDPATLGPSGSGVNYEETVPRGSGYSDLQGQSSGSDWMMMPIVVGPKPTGYSDSYTALRHAGGDSGFAGGVTANRLAPFKLLQKFDQLDRDGFLTFRNRLIAAGIVAQDADPMKVRDNYTALLQQIQTDQYQHHMKMTPDEFIDALIQKNGLDPDKITATWAPGDPTGDGSGARTTTSVSRSIYDLDSTSARGMMTQTLQQFLGRDPSAAEVEDFLHTVQTKASANPNVSRTVQHIDASGNMTTRTRQKDGFGADDASVVAMDRAKGMPDYASYQAVATYFPALVSALGATV